jgi:hypothetical protein
VRLREERGWQNYEVARMREGAISAAEVHWKGRLQRRVAAQKLWRKRALRLEMARMRRVVGTTRNHRP